MKRSSASSLRQLGRARMRPYLQCQIHYLVTEQGRFDQGCPLCARYRSLGLSSLKVGQAGRLIW
ncbi:hypothetical protein CKO42_24200 [Lamprobacter modestohalophilus]|uniref:Uncharacterized protein n=1 Tax=Lamprobacter modestohalophilus TaxID=1064514 RepID=A0A9X0WDL2_9GAMM|nr:hypothetical protein [Lamprobacter modestohalophilus]